VLAADGKVSAAAKSSQMPTLSTQFLC